MKSLRMASLFCLALAAAFTANAYATEDAQTPRAAASWGNFILAQSGNTCMSACRDRMQSCMEKIEPNCNSKGCNNERGACNEQYNECTKNCSGR